MGRFKFKKYIDKRALIRATEIKQVPKSVCLLQCKSKTPLKWGSKSHKWIKFKHWIIAVKGQKMTKVKCTQSTLSKG